MIRILIVDDSETEVGLIKHIIEPESDMFVVAVAKNGKEAVELTALLKPDLITMDIEMPVMNGLEATRLIVEKYPTPIVVISSTVSEESLKATYHILDAGALSAIPKPRNVLDPAFEETRKHIIDVLRSMAGIKVVKRSIITLKPYAISQKLNLQKQYKNYEIVAIGSSVGGPQALKTILTKLPSDFPIPIVIVQHMSFGFINGFANWLGNLIALKVKDVKNQEPLIKGNIYIAPDSFHLEVDHRQGNLIAQLIAGAPVDGFYPSISVLLKSVAKACGENAIGILLTGMGSDGAQGLLALKKVGGHTLIQGRESSIVFGMGDVARSIGAVDQVLELNAIADYLIAVTSVSKPKTQS